MSTPPGDQREGDGSRSHSSNSADSSAVLAVRTGDSNAFGELVQRYQKRLFNLSLMMLRSPESAEEITQDAFVRAFQKLDRYDVKRAFYPWLATIAVRLAQTRLRKKQLEVSQRDPDTTPTEDADPLIQLMRDEDRDVWDLVVALSSGERTAVFLVYRQELTLAEAASAVGVTVGTIKTLLFRARKHLRAAIEQRQVTQQ